MDKIRFNIRLKELRTEKGMKQKDLAALLSIHLSTISDWEARGRRPDFETLYKLSQIFEVSVGYLLGVED